MFNADYVDNEHNILTNNIVGDDAFEFDPITQFDPKIPMFI